MFYMRIRLLCISSCLALLVSLNAQSSNAAVYSNAEIPEIMELSVNFSFFGKALKAESKIKIKRNVNRLQSWHINYISFLSDESKNILKEPCADTTRNIGFGFQANDKTLVTTQKIGDWYIETFNSNSLIAPYPSSINFCPAEIFASAITLTDETGSQRETQIVKICVEDCKKLGLESIWSTIEGPVRDLADQKNGKWNPIVISPLWNASPATAKCKQIISASENKYTGPTAVYEGCNQNIDFKVLNFNLTESILKEAEQNFNRQMENRKYFDIFLQTEFREYRSSLQNFAKEQRTIYNTKVKPLATEVDKFFETHQAEMAFGGQTNTYFIELKSRMAKVLSMMQKDSKSSSSKIQSVTCLKGNLVKVVKGVNPKCPAGFKKK